MAKIGEKDGIGGLFRYYFVARVEHATIEFKFNGMEVSARVRQRWWFFRLLNESKRKEERF